MRRISKIVTSVLLSLAAMSMSSLAADKLAGSEWGPGYPEKQFIRFEAGGRVAGTGGCNRIFGGYEITGVNAIKIGPLASTRMACPDHMMAKEAAFIKALESAKSFRRETGSLELLDEAGEVLARLHHRDWD